MTETDERQTIWMTQAAHDKLTAELAELKGPVRTDIVAKISAARDEGDLKENGGYHAARDELAKLEGRVQQLEATLEKAEVGEAEDDGTVSPGFVVTVSINGKDRTFLLGAREMGDDDIEVISPQSPMGSAVIGAREGEKVSFTAPSGKDVEVTVKKASPFHG